MNYSKPQSDRLTQSNESIFAPDSPLAKGNIDAIMILLEQLQGYGLIISSEGEIWGEFGTQIPEFTRTKPDSHKLRLEERFAPTIAIDLHFYLHQVLSSTNVQRCELSLAEKQLYNCRLQPLTFNSGEKAVLLLAEKNSCQLNERPCPEGELSKQVTEQSFIEAIESENNYCLSLGIHSTLAYIDIDDFDAIKDTYGSHIASEVLSQITTRLESQTRKEDVVAHIKDDEFALIFRAMGENVAEAIDESANVAAKIKQMISAPILIDGQVIQITASIGISVLPKKDKTAEQILADASSGMSQRSGYSKAYLTTFG